MEGLGRLFDLSAGAAPSDLSVAATTGMRVGMKGAGGVDIVVVKGAGTAGQNPTLTLRQHTAASGGVSSNLATIDHYYVKSETTLDGDEVWSRVNQVAAATIVDPGGLGASAAEQQIIVIPVEGAELADGATHVSLDIGDVGLNAQLGAVLYILRDLRDERAPVNLANPQT